MIHIIYILAFTIIAFFAISNLISNLINVNNESRRYYSNNNSSRSKKVAHPELLDAQGQPIHEPLLVMKSLSMEEARQQLDQIYYSSPGVPSDQENKE